MRLICCSAIVVILSVAMTSAAAAQDRSTPLLSTTKLSISEDAITRGMAAGRREIARQDKRDSIKNGTIIGAVIGAAALGGFGAWICHALHEPSDPPCLPDVLKIAAIGAGIGAAGGAGIDAMLVRNTPRPILRVRF
jgi:hypothetical protein